MANNNSNSNNNNNNNNNKTMLMLNNSYRAPGFANRMLTTWSIRRQNWTLIQ